MFSFVVTALQIWCRNIFKEVKGLCSRSALLFASEPDPLWIIRLWCLLSCHRHPLARAFDRGVGLWLVLCQNPRASSMSKAITLSFKQSYDCGADNRDSSTELGMRRFITVVQIFCDGISFSFKLTLSGTQMLSYRVFELAEMPAACSGWF